LGFVDTVLKKKKKKKLSTTSNLATTATTTPLKQDQTENKKKCSFSPKSFYKSSIKDTDLYSNKSDLINSRNSRKRLSNDKSSEPHKKVARVSPDLRGPQKTVVQIPILKDDQKLLRCIRTNPTSKASADAERRGTDKRKSYLQIPTSIQSDPKLNRHKALVKISKLPHHHHHHHHKCLKSHHLKSSSSIQSANNEDMNSVTEIMTLTRVSPVKADLDKALEKTVWKYHGSGASTPTSGECSTSPSSTASHSPSKLLRPAILNVVTPIKMEIKQEPRSSSFTITTATTTTTTTTTNNPFLPTEMFKKSSFLFGGDSDFQSAELFDSENVLYIDDDDDDDDSSNDVPSNIGNSQSSIPTVSTSEHIFGTGLNSASNGLDSKEDLRTFLFNTFAATKRLDPKPPSTSDPKPTASEVVVSKSEEPPLPVCNKLRFPVVQGSNNLIPCKWRGCSSNFTTYGNLSDHLKVRHKTLDRFLFVI